MTNPYESAAESTNATKPTGENMDQAPRTSGRLDQVAYVFISVGYFLTVIGIFLFAILFIFIMIMGLYSMIMGGVMPWVEVVMIMFQGFCSVLYLGVTWAILRTLRIVAKKHCLES